MTQPESKLSRRIMDACRARGAFVFKVHGGPTMMAGLPDITGVWRGQSVWIETKMPGNKPSPRQLYVHEQIRKSGGHVLVAYSVQEVMEWLNTIPPTVLPPGHVSPLALN